MSKAFTASDAAEIAQLMTNYHTVMSSSPMAPSASAEMASAEMWAGKFRALEQGIRDMRAHETGRDE